MQKSKTGKFSIFNSLDVKLEFLTSQVELTQFSVESNCIELKIWAIRLKSSWKCEQFDSILIQVQNVNSKLDSMISLSINFNQLHYSVALSIISWILLRKFLLVVISIFISHKLWRCESIISWIMLEKSLLVIVNIFMSHVFWRCWSIVSWILLRKLLSIVEFWIFNYLMSWIKNLNSDSA